MFLFVSSSNPFVTISILLLNVANCLPSILGNISLYAVLTADRTLARALKALLRASTMAARPPNSFHTLRISFLALDDASITEETVL